MKGLVEFTPRTNMIENGILSHLIGDADAKLPGYVNDIAYRPPDVLYPWLKPPEGSVDVQSVVSARTCPGLDGPANTRYNSETSKRFAKWEAAAFALPRRSSSVVYPDDEIGKERTDICTDVSDVPCCIDASEKGNQMNGNWNRRSKNYLNEPMGCSEPGYVPVPDEERGCGDAAKGNDFIGYKCVFHGPARSGGGWEMDHPNGRSGFCDGSYTSWCGRTTTTDCLLYGSPDARTSVSGDGLSGWLLVHVPKVTNGLILFRMENWHNNHRNKATESWTEPNAGKHSRRLLKAAAKAFSQDVLIDLSLNGKVTTWTRDQFNARNFKIQNFEHYYKLLDDESLVGQEIDYEVGFRVRGVVGEQARANVFPLTHIYYS